MRARLLAPAIVTATALCGCSAGAGRPRPTVAATASAAAASPVGVQWLMVEYQLPDKPRVLVAYGSTLSLKNERYYAQACNGYDGAFQLVGDRIDFRSGGNTQMQCHGAHWELERAFYHVLLDVRWRIEGTRLTLRADDGATFVYEHADSLAPGTGHTVAEGERRGRRYRVWTVGRGNEVVLRLRSLDLAGHGGYDPGSMPNPHVGEYARMVAAGSGPREQVIAGFAPAGTVRMTYRKPKNRSETKLPLYDVPGVRWPVFAGFVERGIDGWLMAAYDAHGRVLAPFTGKRPI
jgi:heat shock protein HslJ